MGWMGDWRNLCPANSDHCWAHRGCKLILHSACVSDCPSLCARTLDMALLLLLSTQVTVIFIKKRKAMKHKFGDELKWKTVHVTDKHYNHTDSVRQLIPDN